MRLFPSRLKCSVCLRQKFFVKERTIYLADANLDLTSNGKICWGCHMRIIRALKK